MFWGLGGNVLLWTFHDDRQVCHKPLFSILVIYCSIINHSKFSDLKLTLYFIHDFMDQEFGDTLTGTLSDSYGVSWELGLNSPFPDWFLHIQVCHPNVLHLIPSISCISSSVFAFVSPYQYGILSFKAFQNRSSFPSFGSHRLVIHWLAFDK